MQPFIAGFVDELVKTADWVGALERGLDSMKWKPGDQVAEMSGRGVGRAAMTARTGKARRWRPTEKAVRSQVETRKGMVRERIREGNPFKKTAGQIGEAIWDAVDKAEAGEEPKGWRPGRQLWARATSKKLMASPPKPTEGGLHTGLKWKTSPDAGRDLLKAHNKIVELDNAKHLGRTMARKANPFKERTLELWPRRERHSVEAAGSRAKEAPWGGGLTGYKKEGSELGYLGIGKTAGFYFRPGLKSLVAAGLLGGGALSLRGRKERKAAEQLYPAKPVEMGKESSAKETAKRKGKSALKGAAIGAGGAIAMPTIVAALLGKRGQKMSDAGAVLRAMVGRKGKGYKKMDKFERGMDADGRALGTKVTQGAAITGAGLGGLLG